VYSEAPIDAPARDSELQRNERSIELQLCPPYHSGNALKAFDGTTSGVKCNAARRRAWQLAHGLVPSVLIACAALRGSPPPTMTRRAAHCRSNQRIEPATLARRTHTAPWQPHKAHYAGSVVRCLAWGTHCFHNSVVELDRDVAVHGPYVFGRARD
jgi:hypothetical protein